MTDMYEILDNTGAAVSAPDQLHTFSKYIKLSDEVTVYPHYQASAPEVKLIEKQLNIVKNKLKWSDARACAYIFYKGILWCIHNLDELKEDCAELIALSNLSSRLARVRYKKLIRDTAKSLWQEVDGVSYTEQEYDMEIAALGFDPDEFKRQFSLEVPKSETIRRWLFANVTDENGVDVDTVRDAMTHAAIVGNDNDWNQVKYIASMLKVTRGERGKWYPPQG